MARGSGYGKKEEEEEEEGGGFESLLCGFFEFRLGEWVCVYGGVGDRPGEIQAGSWCWSTLVGEGGETDGFILGCCLEGGSADGPGGCLGAADRVGTRTSYVRRDN